MNPSVAFRKMPKHRWVVKVRAYQRRLLYETLDLDSLTGKSKKASKKRKVQDKIVEDLRLNKKKIAVFQQSMEEFDKTATIMLSTGLDDDLITDLPEDLFIEYFEKSKEALGDQTVLGFLEPYSPAFNLSQKEETTSSKTSSKKPQRNSLNQSGALVGVNR